MKRPTEIKALITKIDIELENSYKELMHTNLWHIFKIIDIKNYRRELLAQQKILKFILK